jgi:hypothetical protein
MWHLSLKKENKAFLEYKKKSASNTLPTNDYLDTRLGIFPCLSLLHALTANIIQPFPI